MRALKFKGQKVYITTDRIEEDDRDLEKVYYEFRADDQRKYLPILLEETVENDDLFWGTMICEEEFSFNNGDMHTLTEDMGMKLAKGLGLLPESETESV